MKLKFTHLCKLAFLAGILGMLGLSWWGMRQFEHRQWLEYHREMMMLPAIREAAQRHGLSPELVRAVVWKESRFNKLTVGSKGEIGLMQITSGAVSDWARTHRQPLPDRPELFTPPINLEIGCWYLERASRHYTNYASQDILLLAEYNAGRAKVAKDWCPTQPNQCISLKQITFPGTQDYIKQILARKEFYERTRRPPETPQPL